MGDLSKRERAVARRVSEARKAAGLSQKQIAEYLGLTQAGYGHYERQEQPFTVEQVFNLSRMLGRSVEYFLGLIIPLKRSEDELLTLYRSIRDKRLRTMVLQSARNAAVLDREN